MKLPHFRFDQSYLSPPTLIRISDKAKSRNDPRRLDRIHRPAFHPLDPDFQRVTPATKSARFPCASLLKHSACAKTRYTTLIRGNGLADGHPSRFNVKGAPGLSFEITYYRNSDGKTPEHKANAETSAAEGFDALAEFHHAKAATARYNAAYGSESEPAEEE